MLAVLAALLATAYPPDPIAVAAWSRSRELGRHALSADEAAAVARAVRAGAARQGLTPATVLAVVEVESGYAPREISSARCVGMMQLAPATAHEFRLTAGLGRYSLVAIEDNIALGCAYLGWTRDRYHRLDRGLTVYNLGPTRYRGGVSAYARKVLARARYLETRFHLRKNL